jgi:DNA-binding MarR family transcriptional regulator
MNESQLDLKILAAAQRLTDLQRQILQCLKDKGPGLLLELAVRVLKFPEDVYEPLRELQAEGLVETQSVSGGQFGSELYSLTAAGNHVLRLVNDPMFQREAQAAAAPPPSPEPLDPRRQEAELLKKLGDLAEEKGNLDEAMNFYKQALDITRELSATGGSQ